MKASRRSRSHVGVAPAVVRGPRLALLVLLLTGEVIHAQQRRDELRLPVTERRRLVITSQDVVDLEAYSNWVVLSPDSLVAYERSGGSLQVFAQVQHPRPWAGRRGEAPGELRAVVTAGRLGDTVWTIDPALRRLSYFGRAGRFLGAVDLRRPGPSCGAFGAFGLAAGNRILGAAMVPRSSEGTGDVRSPILRLDPATGKCDTLAAVYPGRPFLRTPSGGVLAYQPFDDGALVAVAGDGMLVIVDRRMSPARPRHVVVRRFDAITRNVSAREVTLEAIPASRATRDSVRDEAGRMLREASLAPDEVDDVLVRQLSLPSEWPAVRSLLTGADGSVWLERPRIGGAQGEYVVLGADLRVLGTARFEASERVVAAALPHVWTIRTLDDRSELRQYAASLR